MTTGPVRANCLHRRSTSRPREAFRLSSVAPSRCLDTASTTDVLRYEHPLSNTTFGDCLPRARGKPAGARLRGTPRDAAFPPFASRDALNHLAVIQPPTAPCLTARCRLRVDWPPRAVPEHVSRGERRRFFGERQPGQIEPSDTFTSDGAERERPDACRLSLLQPVHVNATGLSRPEVPSIERDPSERSFEVRGARLLRWPANSALHVFIDVRKHRLDLWPPAVRVRLRGRVRSYDFCKCMLSRARPRTARTSLTTGMSGWDDCHARSKVALRNEDNRRSFTRSGAENTESRHSPSRLLVPETSPQPRSLRAPPVADTALFPVRSDVGRKRCRRRRRTLALRAQRKGHVTPDFREEIRCSGARGAFRRWAVSFARNRSVSRESELTRDSR
jgi:hypothetical protein